MFVDHPTLYKFYIRDLETATNNLHLSFASSNPALFPTTNAVFHWFVYDADGQHWYLTLVPTFGLTGTATNTVTVSDGTNSVSTNIVITVTPPPPKAARFANTNVITIPGAGVATPYPTVINVTGMVGIITNVTMTLSKINHQSIKEVHMLLVSPTGRGMVVFSRISSGPVADTTATLLDAAPDWAPLPPSFELWTEQFRPADYAPADTNNALANHFPAPAAAGPYAPTPAANAFSNAFNGLPANGEWNLYVYDESGAAQGNIVGGWSLMIATDGAGWPTISNIPDQTTTINTATAAIPFTISDPDTPIGNLTLSATSSNAGLVSSNNIVFGGSGTNRTVTVTPVTGVSGTATITVTVSDGTNTTSDAFVLTVNTPPTITGIANQSINEDTSTAALSFTVNDAESAPGSVTLTRNSSDPTLISTNGIVFGGSGTNRTVTVTPLANQSGSATVTLTVSDGYYSASTNFVVTVTAVNDAPTLSGIGNQTVNVNSTSGPLNFTIGDLDTAVGSLSLGAVSSNPELVPTNNIVFGGSGTNRTVTVSPAAGQTGSATIIISVSDGQYSASTNFGVTVSALLVGTKSFTNTVAITIPDQGASSPYPSTINVTGMGGTITNVTVTLRNLTHTWKADVDVLLVSPGGQKVVLMSDAGAAYTASGNVTLTLSDTAAASLPASTALSSGTYKPTDHGDDSPGVDNFPAPAPAAPYGTNLATFNETDANGTWSLYVYDDGPGDLGSIANGWSLTVTTTGGPQLLVTGITAENKVYDATNTATIHAGGATLVGVLGSDDVTLVIAGGSGEFTDKNVGTNKNVQIAGLTLTGTNAGKYILIQPTTTADITPKTASVTASNRSKAYGDTVTFAGTEFTANGFISGDLVISVTLTSAGTAPTATVSGSPYDILSSAALGSGLGNYNISYNAGQLTVDPKALSVTANSRSKTYGDAVTFAGTEFTVSGLVNGDTVSAVTLTSTGGAASATVAGAPYPITPSGAVGGGLSNYSISYSDGILTVTPASVLVTANDASRAYGDTNPVFGVSYSGFVNGEDENVLSGALVISTTAGTNSAVGTYPIIASGLTSTNYSLTFSNGALTIVSYSLTITANNRAKTYGDTLLFDGTEFTASGLQNGEIVGSVTLTSAGAAATAAVTGAPYTIIASATTGGTFNPTNYAITYLDGGLTVDPKLASVTANSTNKTYGDTVSFAGTEFTTSGFINGDTVTNVTLLSAGAGATATVGGSPYAITPSAAAGTSPGNYTIGYSNGTLTVTPALLAVTADDKTRAYDESNPALTANYSGFANGETLATSGVTGSPDLSTIATNTSPAGNYPITVTVGSLNATNYSFLFVDGTMAVIATRPIILTLAGGGTTNVVITWSAVSNVTYRVQYNSVLGTTSWFDLAPDVTATNNTASASDNSEGDAARFYRVLRLP